MNIDTKLMTMQEGGEKSKIHNFFKKPAFYILIASFFSCLDVWTWDETWRNDYVVTLYSLLLLAFLAIAALILFHNKKNRLGQAAFLPSFASTTWHDRLTKVVAVGSSVFIGLIAAFLIADQSTGSYYSPRDIGGTEKFFYGVFGFFLFYYLTSLSVAGIHRIIVYIILGTRK